MNKTGSFPTNVFFFSVNVIANMSFNQFYYLLYALKLVLSVCSRTSSLKPHSSPSSTVFKTGIFLHR